MTTSCPRRGLLNGGQSRFCGSPTLLCPLILATRGVSRAAGFLIAVMAKSNCVYHTLLDDCLARGGPYSRQGPC